MKKSETDWRSKYEANIKYDAENTKRFGFKLNTTTDADIISALESTPSKQGLIKDAIRFYLSHKGDSHE